MVGVNDIVITGLGCVTPIGIGRDAFWSGLLGGKCAAKQMHTLDNAERTAFAGAAVSDFNGKQYVVPRKAIKVMSREVQMSYAAAHLAWQDAGLVDEDATKANLDPNRMGVVYGTEMIPGDHEELAGATRACSSGEIDHSLWGKKFSSEIFPLWMLRNLPNMPACHVGIAIDARGPNNSIAQEEVGSLLALSEAAMVIERDQADLMVVGGVGARITPTRMMYRATQLYNQHASDGSSDLSRSAAFDVDCRGIVPSEGAGAWVIERRSHGVARGAKILGSVRGFASRCGKPAEHLGGSRVAIESAARAAMDAAGISADDLNHVCAQGYSHSRLDVEESHAIEAIAGSTKVSAFSSYFGTAGAASGILELTASLLGMQHGKTLPVLGHRATDPNCPVNVCKSIERTTQSYFLKLSFTPQGQAAAVVIECEN